MAKKDSMFIGILNFQHSNHNYGAVLQAAALAFYLKNKGYKVEHIDLRPVLKKNNTLNKAKQYFKNSYIYRFIKRNQLKYLCINPEVFEEFRIDWIERTNAIYTNSSELSKTNFDAIIVGSDQVWRPSYTKDQKFTYFLDFCDDQVRKISYAASFGVDSWSTLGSDSDSKVKNLLNEFDHISVREDSGVDVCSNNFDVEATHVLDPTLLVGKDFFEMLLGDKVNGVKCNSKKFVYYKLDTDHEFNSLIRKIEDETKITSENIYHYNEDNNYKYNTVYEWVSKIKDSEFIITDSFHCVCLSIIYNKPFIIIANEGRGLTRLKSLLTMLDINMKICHTNSDVYDMIKNKQYNLDYSIVNLKLDELRNKSASFLDESLKITEGDF
ncbi:polysaccharide pyruvyl transferase family protein [Proteus terrae]|uniref:polysaccharide pyruvyl transferase family protein n=1 Tax=Proteus terrae TaxID=1574161 RepID=UPI0034E5C14B